MKVQNDCHKWEEQGPGKSLPGMREQDPACMGEPAGELACSLLALPGGLSGLGCVSRGGAVEYAEDLTLLTGLHSTLEYSSHEVEHTTKSDNCDISDSPEQTGHQVSTLSPVAVSPLFSIHKTRAVVPSNGEWSGHLVRLCRKR